MLWTNIPELMVQRLQNKLLFNLWNVQHDNSEQLSGPPLATLWKVLSPAVILVLTVVSDLFQEALVSNKHSDELL